MIFRIDGIRAGAVRVLVVLGKNDVDPVVGQDKAAGAGFRGNFGGNRAHAAGQDRGHEARSVRLHQLLFANGLAGDEWGAGDRADDLGRCIRPFAAANEHAASGGCGPGLPLHILGLDRLAEADVVFRDEDVHGLQLGDRLDRRRCVVGSTGKICRNTAGTDSDGQDDNACGIHTLTFHITQRRFRRRDGS